MSVLGRLLSAFGGPVFGSPVEHRDWIIRQWSRDAAAKYDAGQRQHGGALYDKAVGKMGWEEVLDFPIYYATLLHQRDLAAHLAYRGATIETLDDAREVLLAIGNVLTTGNVDGKSESQVNIEYLLRKAAGRAAEEGAKPDAP